MCCRDLQYKTMLFYHSQETPSVLNYCAQRSLSLKSVTHKLLPRQNTDPHVQIKSLLRLSPQYHFIKLRFLYPAYKKENRNSLRKVLLTWLKLSGYNYFYLIIVFKSRHLFPNCSGLGELTGSRFYNRDPLLSKYSICGERCTWRQNSGRNPKIGPLSA